MPLHRMVRAWFAQFTPGVVVNQSTGFAGLGLQQLGTGAMADIHAFGKALQAAGGTGGGEGQKLGFTQAAGGNYSKSGMQELGGIHLHTGGTGGAVEVKTPSASELYASYPGASMGSTWFQLHVNMNNGEDTIVPGEGVTIQGSPKIPAGGARLFVGKFTAVPVAIIGMTYDHGIVTVTTDKPHGVQAGGTFKTANFANASFNGEFRATSVPMSHSLTFALPKESAFVSDVTIPSVSAFRPAALDVPAQVTYQSVFALPGITLA